MRIFYILGGKKNLIEKWTKEMKRQVTEKEMEMPLKSMKKTQPSL